MMQYLFLKIGDKKKHRVPATSYINNDHASFRKFMKVTSNLTPGRKCRKTKN